MPLPHNSEPRREDQLRQEQESGVSGNALSNSDLPMLSIESRVEGLTPWGAIGWAWMPAAPDQELEIEASLDGKLIGHAIANQMRQDVARSGRGSGRYGFTLSFDNSLTGVQLPLLRALGPSGLSAVLSGTSWSSVDGYVDSLTRWGAIGWAWMPADPSRAISIEAVLDGRIVGSAVADQAREDIARSGRGTGRYGFTLSFDKPLRNDEAPSLRAVAPDGITVLRGAKWSSVDGYVDSLTRWGAIGWAWIPAAPEQAVQIEAILGDKVLGRATADQMRQEIARSGRGTGQYGFTLSFNEPIAVDDVPLLRALGSDGPTILRGADELKPAPADGVLAASILHLDRPKQQFAAEAFGLSVEGAIDSLTRWGATGWAWMPSSPDIAAKVEAVLDGRVIGQAAADQFRPDLATWNKGTGQYGFILGFDEPLTGDKAPLLRVIGPEGPTVLHGTDELMLTLTAGGPAEPTSALLNLQNVVAASLPAVEGSIDIITRWNAEGWAWMPSTPGAAVQIEAILEEKVIGRATANQMRADLVVHGKGTGLYGFKMSFDEPVYGDVPPVLRVLAAVDQALPGSTSLPPWTPGEKARRTRGTLAMLLKEHAQFTTPGANFEEFDATILTNFQADPASIRPLLIAFYLPQFHAIAENDQFWGKGFTEWRQLAKGISRFPGHYQPRIPRDLGFYNLNTVDALKAQVSLATSAGVNGFAYYYYWFNRQRVLEKPLEMLLKSDVDMPFLIVWANENWTRTWDGSESQVLLKQDYDPNDDEALLQDLARHFVDRRYIRLRQRPLFIIYNPKNIPKAAATIARWRKILRLKFHVDPLIFMAQTFGERDPRPYGLDGAIEFPPHKLADKLPGRATPDAYSQDFTGRVISYDEFVDASLSEDNAEFPLIKTIVPSWDNDSRRPNRGLSLESHSPMKYEAWLRALILRAMESPIFDTPIVAVNAWNEWAEGAYLEPDVYFGASFLNATARAYVSAMAECSSERSTDLSSLDPLRVSVILPNYNHARYLADRIGSVINQTFVPDEIIFLDDCSTDDSITVARDILQASNIPFTIVKNEQNSGSVFRQWIKGMTLAKNELIWIAETDDFADLNFLSHVVAPFSRHDVLASFGKIACVDQDGLPRPDLDNYYNGLHHFSWNSTRFVPAFQAFLHDFTIKNVIPNASGLVFRKPYLSNEELERLYTYRFAGDWYFYILVVRGGTIAYVRTARSYFRVNQSSASRSSFYTERHLLEHQMIIEDIDQHYEIHEDVIAEHADHLSVNFRSRTALELREALMTFVKSGRPKHPRPIRVCVAAHSFAVGGGELLPIELSNELKSRGFHVTYLVMERLDITELSIRERLRSDIPVVFWNDINGDFSKFLENYGIDVINSHNVSVEFQFFLRRVRLAIPYVASLHGGYETVPDLLDNDFVEYLNKTVTLWLYLSDKNTNVLTQKGVSASAFRPSFNAVPLFKGEWIDRRDFRSDHSIAEGAFVMILCSRAIKQKGWETAIDVLTSLARRSKRELHLVLIGDGPIVAELKASNVNRNDITFLGHIDNPIRYFRCFDLGIFPSVFAGETFPLFLIECFQAGLPVVTTDIGEISRIMGDVPTLRPGATVPHSDTHEKIVSKMVSIISSIIADESKYKKMKASAYNTCARFSMRLLADLYTTTYVGSIAGNASTQSRQVETAEIL